MDSDLSAVERMVRMLKVVPITEEFESWFQEIREMMHREVDYNHEREKTKLFRERLLDDPRFIVPRVYDEFCSERVIATSFEPGLDIDAPETKAAPGTPQRHLPHSPGSVLERGIPVG